MEFNNEIQTIVKTEIQTVKKALEEFIEEIENNKIGNDLLKEDIRLVNIYLKYITREDNIKDTENIFSTITTVGNIESELKIIAAIINKLPNSNIPSQTSSQLIGSIKKLKFGFKRLSTHLWKFLSQRKKLKQWSITGNTNLNIFGLSGGINVQLVFEK